MAGKTKSMSQIKQLLLLKKQNVSNRKAATQVGMDKETVNNYVRKAKADPLDIDGLLKLDDPVLEHRLKGGNAAYPDERFEEFKALLPYLEEEMGKSWLASALGHQACMNGYKVVYFNLYRLFEKIALARVSGTLHRFFSKLAQTDLLIIDDFGIKVLDGQQLLDFMEIIEDRHGQKSTIIVSQLAVSNWYDVLKKNTTAADAILDRIVHTAVRFDLKGESMRKKKSTKKSDVTEK